MLVRYLRFNLIQIIPQHYPGDYFADKPSNPAPVKKEIRMI